MHHTFNVKRLCHLEHPALEMLWLEITIGKQKVKICCHYRPPSSSIEFWSTLEKASEEVQGHSIILLGDLTTQSIRQTANTIICGHFASPINSTNLSKSQPE